MLEKNLVVEVTESVTPNAWRSAEPVLTAEVRLLLLLSRVHLDANQRERAAELSRKIIDWDEFARRAAHHFVAPLCLHHFSGALNGPGSREPRAALREVVRPMAMQSLKLAGLQKRFLGNYVDQLELDCAVIKGRAIGTRYYPDASLRYSRDLDILIPVEEIPRLIVLAQKDGYRVYPEARELSIDEAYVLSRQVPVITLAGQEKISIEIHAQLDKVGFLLDHRQMLDHLQQIVVDGKVCQTLSTPDHFLYICLHHTKHFWSRLNWLTDLDAITKSPDFDRGQALRVAAKYGLERTVSACLKFHSACAAEEPWEEASKDSDVQDLMRACLVIINHGPGEEFEMRPDRLSVDFNFEWQFPCGYKRRSRIQRLKELFRPSTLDYQILRLPSSLYCLYYPLRPALTLARRLRSARSGERRNGE